MSFSWSCKVVQTKLHCPLSLCPLPRHSLSYLFHFLPPPPFIKTFILSLFPLFHSFNCRHLLFSFSSFDSHERRPHVLRSHCFISCVQAYFLFLSWPSIIIIFFLCALWIVQLFIANQKKDHHSSSEVKLNVAINIGNVVVIFLCINKKVPTDSISYLISVRYCARQILTSTFSLSLFSFKRRLQSIFLHCRVLKLCVVLCLPNCCYYWFYCQLLLCLPSNWYYRQTIGTLASFDTLFATVHLTHSKHHCHW